MNKLIRKICDAIKKILQINDDSENEDQNSSGLGYQAPEMFY